MGEKIRREEEEASHVAPGKDKDPPPPRPEPEMKKIRLGEEQVLSAAGFSVAPYCRDPEAPQYVDDIAEFYLAAARRLPIAQMPRLAGALSCGGLLLGLNDPVTNIILNAIYLMGKSSDFGVLPGGVDPGSYVDIARRSRAALVSFMVFYFRHLTEAQAKSYLHAARHDLALAISLVEWHRRGGVDLPSYELSPDCSRTKTALWYAAVDEDVLLRDLVRLLASRFSRHLVDPVLDDLRRGEQLSVGRVNDILNLLRHPWSPPSPPFPLVPLTAVTSRDADGNLTIISNIGHDLFCTSTIPKDRVAAFNNNRNVSIVTTSTISRHPSRQDHENDDHLATAAYLSTGSDTGSRLRSLVSTTTARQLQPDIKSLKMCLLDTMHGLYIQALAMLPSEHQPRLLCAMLAGGHCYGVMQDPVSNIVVNSIWYNAHFPHPETADGDDHILIKATRSMTRAESSSLHGLIAILHADRGITEQEAVAYLCKNSHFMMTSSLNQHSLAAAAKAAKHPQPAALVAIFTALLTPEKLDHLRSLLTAKSPLSEVDFKELNTMIAGMPGNDIAAAPVQRMATLPDPGQSALTTMPAAAVGGFGIPATPNLFQPAALSPTVQSVKFPAVYRPSIFGSVLSIVPDSRLHSYVRTKVEELLRRNYPLGPQYTICGVESRVCSVDDGGTICYHVNFLASMSHDVIMCKLLGATTSTPECKLYFAEFWNKADDKFGWSKELPVCLPVQNYHAFPGRCFICEGGPVKIVHPPCGNYFMGRETCTDDLCAAEERHAGLGQ